MRLSLLVAQVSSGSLKVIAGPADPVEMAQEFKLLAADPCYAEIQLWQSDAGVQKKQKFAESELSEPPAPEADEKDIALHLAIDGIAALEKSLAEATEKVQGVSREYGIAQNQISDLEKSLKDEKEENSALHLELQDVTALLTEARNSTPQKAVVDSSSAAATTSEATQEAPALELSSGTPAPEGEGAPKSGGRPGKPGK